MSYDLYFWKAATAPADEVCDQLADEEIDDVERSPLVEAFRAQLLATWPDLADRIAPWAADLDWRQPWGREDLAPYFVSLTLPYSTEQHTLDAIIDLARKHTLITYDPQTEAQIT